MSRITDPIVADLIATRAQLERTTVQRDIALWALAVSVAAFVFVLVTK